MVARLGAAIVRGLQDNGVAACGKHFPGHGDTSVDSHLELPLVEHPPDRIRRVECVPFRAAIARRRRVHHDRARAGAVARRGAAGHAVAAHRPATCCATSSGFEGVILSDDLEMKAIAATYSVPDAAVQAIAAGCDGLLDLQRRRRGAGASRSRRWCTPSRTAAFRSSASRTR